MASKTADETAAGARATGRTADTAEAAKRGAEGIQGDEEHNEKGQHMKSADGPHEPGEAKEPAGRTAVAEIDDTAADGTAADDAVGAQDPKGADEAPEAAKTDVKKTPAAPVAPAAPESAPQAAGQGADSAAASGAGEQTHTDRPQDEDGAYGAHGEPGIVKDDSAADTRASGVGQGAGAVVAAGLGVISLSGSWLGTVAGARESLIGQLRTTQGASVAKQIQEVYGDQWHVTALVGGIFALLALVVGVVVLARPAFGTPGRSQAPWIKSVAWGGVVLGVIGLLLAVLKFSDAILALPSVSS